MPTYEYVCDDCLHHFEIRQGYLEAPLAKCPKCQGRVRRTFQPSPIIFKGSGFYVTDYRPKTDTDGGNGKSEKPDTSDRAKTDKTKTDKTKTDK